MKRKMKPISQKLLNHRLPWSIIAWRTVWTINKMKNGQIGLRSLPKKLIRLQEFFK